MLFLLSACATPSPVPPWFDAFHRVPVKTVLVDGYRIAYLDEGHGPPVILVHGFGGSLWQWEYQHEPLSASHRVITLDMLGAGFSEKPDLAYTPDQLVEFFSHFMDALQIPRASLVGNSMGAGLVIGMALTYPERADRLVLITGLPSQVREKLTSPFLKRALHSWVPAWLADLGNRFAGRNVTRKVLDELIYDHTLVTADVLDRSYRNRKRAGTIRPLLKTARNLPLWEEGFAKRLGEIRHPTLIIWGAEDRVFPPQVGQDLHTVIPASVLELVPKAGHIPMWERPDLVNPLLMKFLQP